MREARTIEELQNLHRMVGPSPDETAEAQRRLTHIQELDRRCNWNTSTPSHEESRYRERRERIMAVQTEYENRYC